MSNLPQNPYSNAQAPLANANPAAVNPSPFAQVPSSQLPPGYVGTKQDVNSNSPHHFMSVQNHGLQNINHYNQSANSSPAFNQSGILPPSFTSQSSPIKPPLGPTKTSIPSNVSSTSGSPSPFNANPSPTPYQTIQQHQINDNAPPLVSSSQFNQPLVNGPPTSIYQGTSSDQFPVTSTPVNSPLVKIQGGNVPLTQAFGPPVSKTAGTITSQPNPPFSNHMEGPRNSPLMQGSQINGPAGPMSLNGSSLPPVSSFGHPKPLASGLPQASKPGPFINGPTMSGPPSRPMAEPMRGSSISGQPTSLPPSIGQSVNRQPMPGPQTIGPPMSGPQSSGLPVSGSLTSGPNLSGPQLTGPYPSGPLMTSGPIISGPQTTASPLSGPTRTGPIMSGPPMTGPTMGPPGGNPMSGPVNAPLMSEPMRQAYPGPPRNGPPGFMGPPGPQSLPPKFPPGPQSLPTQYPQQPPMNHMSSPGPNQVLPSGPQVLPSGPQVLPSGPQGLPSGPQGLPSGHQGLPSGLQGLPSGPQGLPSGPSQQSQNGPKSNMLSRYPQMPPQPMGQYPQQYTTQNMTQQMGNLSITKQGFDQLWGHQTVDLMSCKHILPEYPEEVPEVKLGPGFPDAVNCSPEIFRCTINRIPETNSLLQKSRLPLGILIHPFKDLNHLPVIQCNTIVRCRSCRTYINPFVYFVDAKRWKCNLCFRVNDLPEEFLFDPVSKSYGDPSRRPEIKSATIEFIAPGEYMLRPPQPAVYLFLMDVSQIARESGYLQVVCDTLKACLDELPGDARTQIGFICYDSHVHYYLMSEGLSRPKEMTVLDIEDIFLPSPESLLANLGERRELINELLTVLPQRYSSPGVPTSALGAALQAAYKLMAPTGGRVTVFQTCLPNVGPGALQSREDPNARSSKDVAHLNPSTDFYKRLALDCSGAQVAVDLFLLNSQYSDLATLSGMSKFSGGSVNHIPLYKTSRGWQADLLHRMLSRYLTRKIGFEAVMRVRATRGVTIHTFHGNFFVRSTDLLSLPNVSPDAAFGMQLSIEESLTDLQHVCFQAALLYTSSKGERRIRVHTMSLPVANTLPDVLHAADTQCIIGLLSKMAVDRAQSASLSEAREALMHVAVEALSAHRLASNLPAAATGTALHAPHSLRLIPLYLLALLKRKAFRTGTSTRLDDRVADMCELKSAPLFHLLRGVYPSLYPIHSLREHTTRDEDDELVVDPPRLQLTAERVNSNGCYLLDDGESMIIYVGRNASPAFLSETFAVTAFSQVQDEARSIPRVESPASAALHAFVERLNEDRPYASSLLVLRDNSPSRQLFTDRLVDDRVESAFSYYEFLQHVKTQVK